MEHFIDHHTNPDVELMPVMTHCVFRRGLSWLALPAISVREAMPRPDMVFVPGTPVTFAGLCHVRNEFIPVLNLGAVLSENDSADDQIMLVLEDSDGSWAILVDELKSLRTLEISDAPEADVLDPRCPVVGWARHDNTVIRVLDQSRVRRSAEQELVAMWQSTDTSHSQAADLDNQTACEKEMLSGVFSTSGEIDEF